MPITPVFEQPPVPRPRNAIDWTEVLDALVDHPEVAANRLAQGVLDLGGAA